MPEEHSRHLNGASRASRAREIVASLRAEPSSTDVFDAFWQLDELPVEEVRDALAPWTGPLPDFERLDSATRRAHGMPPKPLRLRTLSVVTDADILDLGPLAEEQLRLAGKSWDGADLAPEDRLDGELEGSFAGTLERRVLADTEVAGDVPLFDVVLFAEDAGVVFAAGTTKVVAFIAYRKVEMRDRRVRTALEDALAAPLVTLVASGTDDATSVAERSETPAPLREDPVAEVAVAEDTVETKAVAKTAPTTLASAEPVETKSIAKKTAPKKAAAKKTAVETAAKPVLAKKSAPTKAVTKKPAASAAKKGAAKKSAPTKRIAAKKPAPKKLAAKKPAPKKLAAKKPAPKKLAAKKPALKKPAKPAKKAKASSRKGR